MSDKTAVRECNDVIVARDRRAVRIEMSKDGIWVTIGGQIFVNDQVALDKVLVMLAAAKPGSART